MKDISIAAYSSGEVFLAWADDRGNGYDIFTARTRDQGETFEYGARPVVTQAHHKPPPAKVLRTIVQLEAEMQ